jgi:hypothetical protein
VPEERYLFRAGTVGYTFPEILEVQRNSLRVVQPSAKARRLINGVSTLIGLGYMFAVSWLIVGPLGPLLTSWDRAIAVVVVFFAGLVAIIVWWDRRSLPLLAKNPAASTPLALVSTQFIGTFQEIRGRTNGEELRVAVATSRKKLEDALRLAGVSVSR